MLTEEQILSVWDRQLSAETRSLYFGELASRYSRQKQIITGLTFFLSSGAAVSVMGKVSPWIPILLSLFAAAITAYTIAFSLDAGIRSMAKFHYAWSQLGSDYERLWNNVYADDAVNELDKLLSRERDLSELATTDAPNDQRRLGYWQDYVFKLHRLPVNELTGV